MAEHADGDLYGALERLAHDSNDQRHELELLVRALRSRLGVGSVRVARRGLWGFGQFESAQFVLGDHSYRVALQGGKIRTDIGDAVGGVGLTPKAVPWQEWFERVNAEIDSITDKNPPATGDTHE